MNTGNLIFTHEAMTTLAFVHLDEHGDRAFTFGRKPGADCGTQQAWSTT